jgi:hypothetical protein
VAPCLALKRGQTNMQIKKDDIKGVVLVVIAWLIAFALLINVLIKIKILSHK